MRGIKTLISLFVILLLFPIAEAKLIENPEAVSYMHVNIVKNGSIFIQPQGSLARATSLVAYISIPLNTNRQESVLENVMGPDSYGIEKDQWGNDLLKLYWDEPPLGEEISYSVAFDVRVYDRIEPAEGKEFPSTDVTRTSLEITERAYNLASGLDDIEEIFRTTEWVYEWIDYDKSYQDLPKSAVWVFENRKGICSAYSNLLISMLRTLGFNAYYVIGYVYTEETPGSYWGPHGWVEVEYEGETISLDPTWLESPVDGTHIKFANSPDSDYKEGAEVLGSQVRLVWIRDDPEIELIEKKDSPRIEIQTEFIPEQAGSESYSLMLTWVSSKLSWDCLLSSMEIQSCAMDNGYFLDILEEKQTLAFCENETLFWLLKTPKLRGNIIYTCPVYVSGAGILEKPELRARTLPKNIRVGMSTPKVLTPNQVFTIETILENYGLSKESIKTYLMFGENVQNKDLELDPGYQVKITWTLQAPATPGEIKLMFFSSSGDLLEQDLTVISKRHVKIEKVSLPENITLKSPLLLNVTVRGLEQTLGEIELRIEKEIQTREFFIDRNETKNFLFSYTPVSEGNKEISIILFSEGRYEDGMIGNLLVLREFAWWEQIIGWVSGFFAWISSLFGF